MKYQCKIKAHNIVLLGNFNPKIFQPAWFAAEGLIKSEEAEEATIEIIHSAVVIFTAGWLRLEVTQDKFIAATSQEPYDVILRDLVVGTFKLLQYTPVTQLGINRDMHFQIDSIDAWHNAGHMLTPKPIWNGILNKPGMLAVQMTESERQDGLKGSVNVKVEPSKKAHPGIYFNVNDHIEKKSESTVDGCKEIVDILQSHWEISYKRSEHIINTLIERLTE